MSELHRAMQHLASRCDGAHARDGEGFSRFDRELGLSLASSPPDRWTPRMVEAGHRLATKYRGQLERAGITVPPQSHRAAAEATRASAPRSPERPRGFKAEIAGDLVCLTSAAFPGEVAVNAVKSITGRSFSKLPSPRWYAPLSSADELLRVIDAGYIHADDATMERIRGAIRGQAEAVAASQRVDAEITIEGLGGTLRPYQRGGTAFLSEHRRVLLADEMGLGKTVQALAALWVVKAFPAVIVCPASLKINWQREASKWLPAVKRIEVLSGKPKLLAADTGIAIINYDVLSRWVETLISLRPKGLVFDESQYLKTGKAQRTKAAQMLAAVSGVEACYLLTGTPVLNAPVELISQLQILGRLRELGGWKGFTSRYCIAQAWGGFARGGRNLTALNTEMRKRGIYIRREKSRVLTELPPKQRVTVPIELESRAAYAKVLAEVKAEIKAAKLEKAKAAQELREPEGWAKAAHVTGITKLRVAASKGKIAAAVEWCREMSESSKLVVFAHHREIVLRLAKELGAPTVMGDMTATARQASVDRFQTDPTCRAIVLNLQAGGVGLTLTAASDVVFVESAWTPGLNDQAEDRCHRMGQRDSVTAWYLEAAGTVDEWLSKLIAEKRQTVGAVTDGDAGAMQATIDRLAAMVEAA